MSGTYFGLDQLKEFTQLLEAGQSRDDLEWYLGDRAVDSMEKRLAPELLTFADSMGKVSSKDTKQAYAKTAARMIALSVVAYIEDLTERRYALQYAEAQAEALKEHGYRLS